MKIAVIGAGNIGATLGKKWANGGHDVVFGVRDPQADRIQRLLETTDHWTRAASIRVAVIDADVVLFAVPGRAMTDIVLLLEHSLNGKILIDATNKVGQPSMHSLDLLRQAAPGSAIFRAFSNLGWEIFSDPLFGDAQADLFYCGDDGDAQRTVDTLISAIGLRPIYIGGLEAADIVDALTRLYFLMVQREGHRRLAFRLQTDE